MSNTLNYRQQFTGQERSRHIEWIRSLCLPARPSGRLKPSSPPSLDFDWMIAYAVRQGLAPLLHRRLEQLNDSYSGLRMIQGNFSDADLPWKIDRNKIRVLQDSYLSTLRRNSLIQTVLKEINHALDETSISCIVWKGAAFINSVYTDIGLRPMDDIDLLIPQQHLSRFQNILQRLDFAAGSAYPLNWRRGDIVLDLHTDAVHGDRIASRLNALPITAEVLVEAARPLAGFKNLLTLSAADALICLSVHALKHGFSKDIWLMDAAYLLDQHTELITRPEMLIQRARNLRASFPLFILFSLIETRPMNLKFGFTNRLHPAKYGFLSRLLVRSFKTARQIPHAGELFYFFLLDSLRQKVLFLRETLFPSHQVMQQLFPSKPSWMPYWSYYPQRSVRLATMGVAALKAFLYSRANEKQHPE